MGKKNNPFEIDDCVRLKNSTQKMSVEKIGNGKAMCFWRDSNNIVQHDIFNCLDLIHCADNITSNHGSLSN